MDLKKFLKVGILILALARVEGFAADPAPAPHPSPTIQTNKPHRFKMGDVDKVDNSWWNRTSTFLETGIGVAMFFWLPQSNINYQSKDTSINAGSRSMSTK